MLLYCFVQKYHWGKKGSNSVVAKLASGNSNTFKIDENTPYAEFWMGTHPNGPSVIMNNGLLLIDWLRRNQHLLGSEVREQFGSLPFLFKVLSVETALSIQAHPAKQHAEILFKESPEIYKDPNHKPELAIALTKFEALCGFRPYSEIKKFLQDIPQLREVIGEQLVANFVSSDGNNLDLNLRKCFRALMNSKNEIVSKSLNSLIASFSKLGEYGRAALHSKLAERLNSQYPGDVGVFCIYFFNYLVLNPGDVIYLAANEPHAYLFGDCIECMACSDNVVRAGLTPKMKDIETLCGMLTYICEPASKKFFQGVKEDVNTIIYKPPVPDFAVAKVLIKKKMTYFMITRKSASICIVIKGKAKIEETEIKAGSVFFLFASQSININVTEHDFLLFQALANV